MNTHQAAAITGAITLSLTCSNQAVHYSRSSHWNPDLMPLSGRDFRFLLPIRRSAA